jgi:hypothetical protein
MSEKYIRQSRARTRLVWLAADRAAAREKPREGSKSRV